MEKDRQAPDAPELHQGLIEFQRRFDAYREFLSPETFPFHHKLVGFLYADAQCTAEVKEAHFHTYGRDLTRMECVARLNNTQTELLKIADSPQTLRIIPFFSFMQCALEEDSPENMIRDYVMSKARLFEKSPVFPPRERLNFNMDGRRR